MTVEREDKRRKGAGTGTRRDEKEDKNGHVWGPVWSWSSIGSMEMTDDCTFGISPPPAPAPPVSIPFFFSLALLTLSA
ncbi:hypothetical protein TIFTF001_030281 [Ficus carica]|uniref:Uncharacterized protein n=1 Tax=Ficus carica TaxID=3494 RepID=A0AA88J4P2_FICCA|nr:hypothetical protein TIFTF001_030281 [Ficus carica]